MKIKNLLSSVIFLSLLLMNVFANNLYNDSEMRAYYDNQMNHRDYLVLKAKVIEVQYDDTDELRDVPLEADIRYQHLKIKILNGNYKNEELIIKHTIERIMPGNYIFKPGDRLLLRVTEKNAKIDTVKIEEKVRDTQVIIITILFITLLILFGKLSGLKTLLSLVLTLGLIFGVYIPLILKRFNPLLTSVFISIISVVVALLIIMGKNLKTKVAIIGTICGIICSAILSVIFGKFTKLTGFTNESAISLFYIPHFRDMNFQGILYGTILIGAVGAIMDIATSISTSLYELKNINKDISKKELFKSGINIGKDILGSMSNTLILAYVGSTLHMIILFIVYKIQIIEIINLDEVASEIVRSVAGSIALLLTIPFTVIVGANLFSKK
ncbi:putative membrane protein [Peptoniphilus olsenii]|uniref:Membrane protein n=1 Tax=Peptoniphilus olsenii TaxID=411570 RepID=A0ABV2J944_9FIRM